MQDEKRDRMCKIAILCGSKALVIKRSKYVWYHPGRWDVPGGAAEPGESNQGAAARETFEETGFEPDSSELSLVNSQWKMRNGKPVDRFCFALHVDEEFEPKLSFEHSEYSWLEVDDILDDDGLNLPSFYKDCLKSCLVNVELF